jgi:hypothetical protein
MPALLRGHPEVYETHVKPNSDPLRPSDHVGMIADRQALPKLEWQLRDGTDGVGGPTVRVD